MFASGIGGARRYNAAFRLVASGVGGWLAEAGDGERKPMYVANVVVPVFLIVALGAVLRRTGFLNDQVFRGLNRLAYWVGLPCLLVQKLATCDVHNGAWGGAFWVLLAGIGSAIVASFLLAGAMRLERRQVGAFIQAAFRGNLSFVGLAVVMSAFSALPDGAPDLASRAEAVVVLALGAVVPFNNTASVVVLLAFQHRLTARAVGRMVVLIVTNPFLIACVIGVAISLLPWTLPGPVDRTLEIVGRSALPVALLCVGGCLAATEISGRVLPASVTALVKVALCPTVGWFVAQWLGCGRVETGVAVILLACPTSVSSYVLAEKLDNDAALTAGAIVISTLLSIVSLSVVVGLL